MRVAAIVSALALCALFARGLSQDPTPSPTIASASTVIFSEIPPPPSSFAPSPTPTPAPAVEDFVFTFRRPMGCANASTCDYFVSISQDEENDALNFYLEAEAVSWVAIGFSETPGMFSADCLGCVRIGDNVTAVDTWNLPVPDRFNVIDATQDDITQYLAEYDNGRIRCNFSRSVAGNDPGQDLDLAQNYFHLYGTGVLPLAGISLPVAFNNHGVAGANRNIPFFTTEVVNITDPVLPTADNTTFAPATAPTNAPIDYTIRARSPSNCQPSSCDFFLGIQVNQADSSFLDFYLEGNAQGWLAVGFSLTSNMFSADVVGCNRVGSEVVAGDTYNEASPNRLNVLDNGNQNDVTQHSGAFENGRISCSFSRVAAGVPGQVSAGQDFDLTADTYFVMYGYGDTAAAASSGRQLMGSSASSFSQHQVNPSISANRIAPDSLVSIEIAADDFRTRMVQSHGILMIIAWIMLAVTAIFFAAWMKPALPNGEWFQVHRAFMIASLIVAVIGFILIFIAFKDNSPAGLISFSDGTRTSHFAIGIIIMVLHIANPIISIFRCKPTGKFRWIFNLIHGTVIGTLAELLALTNIGLGISLYSRFYSVFNDLTIFWVYLAFLVFFMILIAVLFVLFLTTSLLGDKDDRAKTAPSLVKPLLKTSDQYNVTKPPPDIELNTTSGGDFHKKKQEDAPPQRKPPSKDAPFRWVFLVIFLTVMVPMTIALVVLIALIRS